MKAMTIYVILTAAMMGYLGYLTFDQGERLKLVEQLQISPIDGDTRCTGNLNGYECLNIRTGMKWGLWRGDCPSSKEVEKMFRLGTKWRDEK